MRPRLARAMGLRFVHQEPAVFPDLTVAENLAIGNGLGTSRTGRIRWQALHRHAAKLLERFEIDAAPEDRMSELAPAARAMVAVARALEVPAPGQVLLLDEPTASLGARAAGIVLEGLRRLAADGHAVLFASHRLEEVFGCCDRISVLRDGRLVTTVAARTAAASTVAEMIAGAPIPAVARTTRRAAGKTLLAVRVVEALGLGPVSFELRASEIVGIAGPPGPACSALLRSIFGVPTESLAAGIAYVPADRAVFPEMSVCENLFLTDVHRRGALRRRPERECARRVIHEFRIGAPSETAPLSTLSGGNRQKVVLARWLRRRPRVLLLDDPTRSVDVAARAQIHRLIRAAVDDGAAGAIVVSSDLHELEQLADRVLVVGRGGVELELGAHEVSYHRLVELGHRAAASAA
jgi:ribose transport system ATP-binding protein